MDRLMWPPGHWETCNLTLQTPQPKLTLDTKDKDWTDVCDRVQQYQSPDLWGVVYNEETRPIFIWSVPSKKKIEIIIKAGEMIT